MGNIDKEVNRQIYDALDFLEYKIDERLTELEKSVGDLMEAKKSEMKQELRIILDSQEITHAIERIADEMRH